jgi:transcription elongation GreA/GreB family factor
MGRAVVGSAPGDVVTVQAPNRSWQARIVSVD